MEKSRFFIYLAIIISVFGVNSVFAVDSNQTRLTLKGLKGVHVVVEELQPNIKKYERQIDQSGLNRGALKKDAEDMLKQAGVKVLTWDQMLKTPGRPVLYVNVNTHENEKYWFGYDVRVELQQIIMTEVNPRIKTVGSTWSLNMTGATNIGQLDAIKKDVGVMVGRFISAYYGANNNRR